MSRKINSSLTTRPTLFPIRPRHHLSAGPVAFLVVSGILTLLAPVASGAGGHLDFPLAPRARWIYHLRQELGQGVKFSPEDAKLAKGNLLETQVISQVMGQESLGGRPFVRVDSSRNGRPWLSEWYSLEPGGLFVARRIESGNETDLNPPQKQLSNGLQPGEQWDWKAADAPVSSHTSVLGRESVTVKAGTFQAVRVRSEMTIRSRMVITVRQDRWFVPGIGYVKQDTTSAAGPHMISHVTLTLEKFESAP